MKTSANSNRKNRRRPDWRRREAAADRGTPEVQARRALQARGGGPALTEYPLGIMLLRGLITREQHGSGCVYANLYRVVIGRGQVSYSAFYLAMVGAIGLTDTPDEATLVGLQQLFRQGKERLLAAGRRVCDATENLVVFQRPARFLDGARRRPVSALRADAAELEAVRAGLDALVACYGKSASARPSPVLAEPSPANENFSVDSRRKTVL